MTSHYFIQNRPLLGRWCRLIMYPHCGHRMYQWFSFRREIVKLSLCTPSRHMRDAAHSSTQFLTSVLENIGQLLSPPALLLRKMAFYTSHRRLAEPRRKFGLFGEEKQLFPSPKHFHYTDYAIPASTPSFGLHNKQRMFSYTSISQED